MPTNTTASPRQLADANSQAAIVNPATDAAGNAAKLGFYGTPPVTQPVPAGNTHTPAAGSTTPIYVNTTFDGGIGNTAYTVGDIVAALKSLGLLSSTSMASGVVTPSYTYDTAIGQGVGTDGFASLPLRAGAKRIYVDGGGGTGSDANNGLTPATSVATLAHAVSLVTIGAGDQVCINYGGVYSESLPDMRPSTTVINGFSAAYPTVIQSYDKTDPTNEAKFGRTGTGRPVFTGSSHVFLNGHGGQYIAVRGLDFNPGNVAGVSIGCLFGANSNTGYVLWENIRFQYTMLNIQGSGGQYQATNFPAYKVIVRNCSGHGQWDTSGDQQMVYVDNVDGFTMEDCAGIHVGWKEGANRSDAANVGGATIYSHIVYIQDSSRQTSIMRRNVIVNAATDGGRMKAGGLYQNNVVINTPIQVNNGEGNTYTVDMPTGCYHDISGNVGFGSGKIDGSAGSMWGWHIIANARVGSAVHHNIAAWSVDGNAVNALMMDAAHDALTTTFPGLPSYGNFYSNVSYKWNASGNSFVAGSNNTTNPALMTYAVNNNVWDDPTGGTNKNWSAVTLPNPYTMLSVLALANPGYVDLNTAQTDWQNNPENRGWRNIIALSQTGYGVAPVLQDLVTTVSLTIGVIDCGLFVGTLDGSTLSSSDLPPGVTLDSDCRFWRYDGTGTAGSGTFHVTETNGASSHTTAFAWAKYAAPVLSGGSTTPSYNTTTASISTNVGSGTLYWMITTDTNVPTWPYIREGINIDTVGQPTTNVATVYGNQAISASGTQNISGIGSGLTQSTAYKLYCYQMDGNNNPSLVTTLSFSTTAAPIATLSSPSASPQATTEIIRVTTDTGAGTLYAVVTTSSTSPTAAQIIAGQNNLGTAAVWAGNKAATAAGVISFLATGLTASTSYYVYFVQVTSGNSNIATTGLSATGAASTSVWSSANSNAAWTLGGTTAAATASSTTTSWTEAYGSTAKTTGVWTVVKTTDAGSIGEAIGFSKTGIGNANFPGSDTGSVWWRGNGDLIVGGSVVGNYNAYDASTSHVWTLVNDSGFISLYCNGVLYVDRYNASAIATSFVPAISSSDNPITRTANFTNY